MAYFSFSLFSFLDRFECNDMKTVMSVSDHAIDSILLSSMSPDPDCEGLTLTRRSGDVVRAAAETPEPQALNQ